MNGLVGQTQTFGERNFGNAKLGDKRRTKRLVETADLFVRHPGGTNPDKLPSPPDLKAFYRLMDCETVTHQSVLEPHRDHVVERINQCNGPVLLLHDSTELDYSKRHSLDLGQIGNGHGKGYICHNSLAVEAAEPNEVLGLRQQILHRRATVDPNETKAQRREREDRESRLWIDAVRDDGPYDVRVIDVCDRGADTFEMLDFEISNDRGFVIRSSHNRRIELANGEDYLHDYARTLETLGTFDLTVHGRGSQPNRTAKLAMSAGEVTILPPKDKSGDHGSEPLVLSVIRVWEIDPPKTIKVAIGSRRKGKRRKTREVPVEPIEWFLLTNEAVNDFTQAWTVVGYYEKRWIVEEFPEAQKTGCGIETFQFTSEERLQPAIALVSVIATALLQLRNAARRPDAHTQPARSLLAVEYVELLSRWRHKKPRPDWTVHDFYYALARLGGHQNRKNDPPPGWIVLWRGWTKLQHMLDGAEAVNT